MIFDPITINKDATVYDAMTLMADNKIGGIPVVDENRKLIGIVTNRDLRFEHNTNRPVSDVMTRENIISITQQTDLEHAADILQHHKIEKLPIVDETGKLIGFITYKDITKSKDRPNSCKDNKGRLRVAAAVGVTSDTMERIEALVQADVDAIVIDTSHGHSKGVIITLKEARKRFANLDIVCGNIATAEAARDLIKAGADAIKVGIGRDRFVQPVLLQESGCLNYQQFMM